jgi:unsaturated chondroitin disaccharide hydrolase
MPITLDPKLTVAVLLPKLERLFSLSAEKIISLQRSWDPQRGTPVFTVKGRYTSRGWTEWTQGFQVGSALLQFDATNEHQFLELGRQQTLKLMASHLTHFGVHDHGFNNVSTYGNLWRFCREKKIPHSPAEADFYQLALKGRILCLSIPCARCDPSRSGISWAML